MLINYKGELKEERFLSFILMKISEAVVSMFDESICCLKVNIEKQSSIKLIDEEQLYGLKSSNQHSVSDQKHAPEISASNMSAVSGCLEREETKQDREAMHHAKFSEARSNKPHMQAKI